MKIRRSYVILTLLALALCMVPFRARIRSAALGAFRVVKGKKSLSERVGEFRGAVHDRLAGRLREIAVDYPPKKIALVGLKQERALEVWVANDTGQFKLLKPYPILAASGTLGPKLAEKDNQVPEGLYRIKSLNPNSLFHLALRVNYPNGFDREKGRVDGRVNLGSDIMIHGKAVSVGCLAIGDQAVEDLFVLAAETGIENIDVILSPVDFRVRGLPSGMPQVPPWTSELYADIQKELMKLTEKTTAPNPSR